jgi:methylmalonyl-CoA/ethylmalonyl-CoA epimerase
MGLPIDIIKVDHVAWATWDATSHVRLLTEVLGAGFVDGGDDTNSGFRWLQFQLPNFKVEIVEPLSRDGFLYRFLTKRGEGMHHMTVYVADLAKAIEQLRDADYEPVDINLVHATWKEAFLSPRETNGVLIQLAQTTDEKNPFLRPLEEYLADRPNLRPD